LVKINLKPMERMFNMELSEMPSELVGKVSSAALDSFEEFEEGFNKMKPEQIYKTAFINGYNCAYNIYDVAEEKLEAFRKDGEVPEQDIPDISVNGQERAAHQLDNNKERISFLDSEEIYTMGYEQGFSGAWKEFIDVPVDEKLEEIVDYYLN
jgi:hypothetical protein